MSGSNKLYKELKETERNTHMELLLKVWDAFLQKNDPSLLPESIFINEYNLIECVERVSKRKFYFKVFHGIEHLAEFKEVALLCFWICKLKPFVVTKPESPLCASVNELFCVHLVYCMLDACKEHADNFHYPDSITVKNLIYALKYQDLSKEALIQYMECLALSCGIKIHRNMNVNFLVNE